MSTFQILVLINYAFCLFIVFDMIFISRKKFERIAAWSFTLVIPFFGLLMYLLIGAGLNNRVKSMLKKKAVSSTEYNTHIKKQIAEIKKEFSFLFPRYSIAGLGWEIEGRFMAHEYEITQGGRTIVSISKEWMTWGDSYELDILNPADEIVALAVVLTIDCVTESNSGASVTVSN